MPSRRTGGENRVNYAQGHVQQNRLSISSLDSSVQKVLMAAPVGIPTIFNWTVCARCCLLCKEGCPKRGSETVHLFGFSVS